MYDQGDTHGALEVWGNIQVSVNEDDKKVTISTVWNGQTYSAEIGY